MQELRYKHFNNVGISDYFPFYLGYDDYQTKEDRLKNKEESIHYEYIWNFLAWQLEKEGLTVKADYFVSQFDVNKRRKEENEIWEKEKKQILNEITPYLNENQDFLFAIKEYNKIRVGKIIEMKPYNGLILSEVKKDLNVGKVKIDVSSYNTIAIIKTSQLPILLTKEELIELIDTNANFEGLIWKKTPFN